MSSIKRSSHVWRHRTDLGGYPPETLHFWLLFFPRCLRFLPAVAMASLREPPLEAFDFDSVLCLLSLPLLSAPICPLWVFFILLLCMMNVISFALFN